MPAVGPLKNVFGHKSEFLVGLDIGSFNVKLVKLVPPEKGPAKLLAFGSKELPQSAIIEKDIKDREGVIYTVQTLTEEVAEDALEVVINLSGHKVFTDRIQVSLTGKKTKLSEAVMIEAEQRIPTGTSGIVVDYQSLGKIDEGKKEDVILVAARRELVEDYFNVVRDAGLDPIAIDIDFFATYNAFEFNYGIPAEGAIALVNIGHTLTNITFIIDGAYYTVRDVSTGAQAIWNSIQMELRLSSDDLTELMHDELPMDDKGPYRSAVFTATEELKLGLDVAFSYIENVTSGRTIDQIYLAGGGALIEGVPEAIGQKMSIPLELLNSFKGLKPAEGVFSGVDPSKIAALYSNAVGMALRAEV
ncbi:hypothetical protein DRQ36_07555 [bacterium]|nr:MAG: hypothetical protein DRQ36_07555 [bacterium]